MEHQVDKRNQINSIYKSAVMKGTVYCVIIVVIIK